MEEHIAYFRALVEGREDVEGWWAWLSSHEHELQRWLSPGQILRLKRAPLYTIYGILSEKGYNYSRPKHYIHPKFHRQMPVPVEWLTQRVSPSDIERELQKTDVIASEWSIIKSKMVNGDECWAFRSPPQTWANMMGRAGYAVVRDGTPIDSIVTVMN